MLLIALKENVRKRQHRIDYIGAALMAAATSLLMFALVHAETLSGLEMFGASSLARCCSARCSFTSV